MSLPRITSVPVKDMIFVFGSNREGLHGGGAAYIAYRRHGAIMRQGEGHHGRSYALPTKQTVCRTLSLCDIREHVQAFLKYANDPDYDQLQFQVTCVGCGLAGHHHRDIAPMFKGAPTNCHFDTAWFPYLGDTVTYWGTF